MAAIVEFIFHAAAGETFMQGVHNLNDVGHEIYDHYWGHSENDIHNDSILAYPPPQAHHQDIHSIGELEPISPRGDTDVKDIDWDNLGNVKDPIDEDLGDGDVDHCPSDVIPVDDHNGDHDWTPPEIYPEDTDDWPEMGWDIGERDWDMDWGIDF